MAQNAYVATFSAEELVTAATTDDTTGSDTIGPDATGPDTRVGDSVSTAEIGDLAGRIVSQAGRLAAATCGWLLMIAEFDARDGCGTYGLRSTAALLSHACGLSKRTAFEHVRVARSLRAQPALVAAMSAGRVSFSQARAITRVVGLTEEQTDALIRLAKAGTASHLEVVARGLRSVADLPHEDDGTGTQGVPAETVRWAEKEWVRSRWTGESTWRLSAALTPERGALIDAAIDRVMREQDLTRPDALVRMAEMTLAITADTSTVRALKGDERAATVIHLDASAVRTEPVAGSISNGTVDGEVTESEPVESRSAERDRCPTVGDAAEPIRGLFRRPARPGRPYGRLARGGPGLPDSVIRHLGCAGRVRTLITSRLPDGRENTIDAGRSHRLISDGQLRAVRLRDHDTCRHPGCTNTKGLEAHHVWHWIDGGPTKTWNLILLCPFHHHTLHHGAFTITATGDGTFHFALTNAPEGPARRTVPKSVLDDDDSAGLSGSADYDLSDDIEHDHSDLDPDAARSEWKGERLDRHYAVWAIAAQRGEPSSSGTTTTKPTFDDLAPAG